MAERHPKPTGPPFKRGQMFVALALMWAGIVVALVGNVLVGSLIVVIGGVATIGVAVAGFRNKYGRHPSPPA